MKVNPDTCQFRVFGSHFVRWILALLLAALPQLAFSQFHGALLSTVSRGPNLDARAHVGDRITTTIRIQNNDGFLDSLTLTSVVHVVHHTSGDTTSTNLLPQPVTLTNVGDAIWLTNDFFVFPTDGDYLFGDVIVGGRDNRDGPSGPGVPLSFQLSFPDQIQVLKPAVETARSCLASGVGGLVTYVGSVSNSGNTSLSNVVVSNVVNSLYFPALGPIHLAVGQSVTFTNSFRLGESLPGFSLLLARGTDPLGLTVANAITVGPFPQVAILSPATNATYTAPANILVSANATNPGADIVQVEFLAGTNLIGIDTTSPFSLTWSNVPTGSYTVVARATDHRCNTGLSTPVNIGVDPMSVPAFRFEQPTYTVGEGSGALTLRVARNFSGFATVNFATGDSSANSGADYGTAAGQLVFQSADAFKDITVTVLEDLVVEGEHTFTVALSLPSTNGMPLVNGLASPSVAAVTIVDNDLQTGSSVLAIVPPTPVDEASLGSLRVYLTDDGGVGQWRLPWERIWRASGIPATGLLPGEYELEFKPVTGRLPPPPATVLVSAMQEQRSTNAYTPIGVTPSGSLTVFLDPPEVADSADLTCRGQWQRDGEGNVWHNSGETVAGLPADNYLIKFKVLTGPCTWGKPADRLVPVLPGASNALRSAYYWNLAAPQLSPLDFTADIQNGYGLRVPYPFNGQIVTEIGEASGFVVKERVVLTAAHVVFDDFALSYLTDVRWLFQRHPPAYNPAPQTVRGYFLPSGYAAQRAAEDAPGVSSTASFDLDVAALYFFAPAGRGGYGGYLVSETPTPLWLQTNEQKVLVGYPVEGVLDVNRGKMHAIRPQPMSFTELSNAVFQSASIRGFPGNSGGPLCVLNDNGYYYPAGVYVGGSDSAIVRAIDSRAVELINRAELVANAGTNNTGGGVIRITPTTGLGLCLGYLTVTLEPASAYAAGAAWRIAPQYTRFGALTGWTTNPAARIVLNNGPFEIEFRAAEGFLPPAPPEFSPLCSTVSNLVFTYVQLLPRLDVLNRTNLVLTGVTNRQYRVEYSSGIGSTSPWTPWTNLSLPASQGSAILSNALAPVTSNRFYRAVRLP